MSTTLNSALVADLAREVSGSVLGPRDPGYEAARAVHNGMVDRRPALIIRCRTMCDVAAALALARRAELEVSVRDLEPFKTWGSPLLVDVGPMPYPVMNTLLDAGFPDGSLN